MKVCIPITMTIYVTSPDLIVQPSCIKGTVIRQLDLQIKDEIVRISTKLLIIPYGELPLRIYTRLIILKVNYNKVVQKSTSSTKFHEIRNCTKDNILINNIHNLENNRCIRS